MPTSYTKEQAQRALEKLPEELQEALFSIETTDAIWNACAKQNISGPNHSKITEYVGYILMGLVLPQEFEQLLQKEIKLPKKVAQEVAREINRFVFYPVKPALEQLHTTEIATASKTLTPKPSPPETEQPESPEEPSGPDIYREPIE